jgi:hypothetical protein
MVDSIVVGPCEIRFPHLVETERFQDVDTGKFSCTFMFSPDSDSIAAMKKKIAEVGGGKGSNPLSQIPEDAEYDKGMWKVKAKSKWVPKIVDAAGEPVSADKVMGATVQAVLGFDAYTMGSGGVTTYLQAIRVLRAGTGGEVDFGPVPDGYEPGADLEDTLPF